MVAGRERVSNRKSGAGTPATKADSSALRRVSPGRFNGEEALGFETERVKLRRRGRPGGLLHAALAVGPEPGSGFWSQTGHMGVAGAGGVSCCLQSAGIRLRLRIGQASCFLVLWPRLCDFGQSDSPSPVLRGLSCEVRRCTHAVLSDRKDSETVSAGPGVRLLALAVGHC